MADLGKILSFMCFDGFFTFFLDSQELEASLAALRRGHLSMDLGEQDLCPGNLVVSGMVATQVVEVLQVRERSSTAAGWT